MKKSFLLIIVIALITLASCELYYSQNPYEFNVITIALDYNNVDSSQNHLSWTISDATNFDQALKILSDRENVSYNSNNYYQIGNNQSDLNYPTKSTITTALNTLAANSNSNSINIIFYSGHGYDDGSWVLTNDTKFKVDDLYNAISTIKGKTIIISDSCFSGNFYKDSAYSVSEDGLSLSQAFEKFISSDSKYDTEDIYILSASQSDYESYELGSLAHGVLTYYILEGLGWNESSSTINEGLPPATKNGILSIDSLTQYITPKILYWYYIGYIGYQVPQVSGGRYDVALFTF